LGWGWGWGCWGQNSGWRALTGGDGERRRGAAVECGGVEQVRVRVRVVVRVRG